MKESSASHPFGRLEEARSRNPGCVLGEAGRKSDAEARAASALLQIWGAESGAAEARRAWGIGGWWLGEPEKKSLSRS